MKLKLISLFILGVFAFFSPRISAQVTTLDEYKLEIGASGGLSYYIGDANQQLFSNMNVSYGGFLRYLVNQRIAFRAELNSTNISGNYLELNASKPFSNGVLSADLCAEFNFFDLEQNPYKRLSKIFSPYIFAGGGVMSYLADMTNNSSRKISASIPFGVGMKVKLGNRWNLNLQWSNTLLLSDNLEGILLLDNPNKLNGTNIFNNDLLSTLTVGISFDFWKKQCKCLNYN